MYVCKRWFRILPVIGLITLTILLAVDIPTAFGDGGDSQFSIPEKTELKYPTLGSTLDRMAATVEEGELSAKETAKDAPVSRDESVAVTIYLSGNVDEVVSFLEDNGGDPRNVGEDYIEAYVPVTLLGPVSEQPGVMRVREIVPRQPDQSPAPIAGHGPQAHLSESWNLAGYSGQGVKVGIIDLGFEGFSGLMGTELPATVIARCYTDIGVFTQDLADCEVGGGHGTIVAESLVDIAPDVSLYIAHSSSKGDDQAATDWMVSQGVSVINYSSNFPFDGPGDGTSPFGDSPLNTLDRAVDGGIIWVSSAGNKARRTWFHRGPYSDSDGDGVISFSESDEGMGLSVSADERVTAQLRWEDSWPKASTNLDLCLGRGDTFELLLCSDDVQSGESRHFPTEGFWFVPAIDTDIFDIVVFHRSGSVPDWIQLTVQGVGSMQHYTSSGSIVNPAESANPGMLAVGAAPWFDVDTIEPFSSRGPTPDGRVKPDIVGADCGETALLPLDADSCGFPGTSQAAPHVAGMAALVLQAFRDYSPVQVANYLKDNAAQRESPDPNNTWGHGFAQLPAPPATDRDALEALYNATDGPNWTNNSNWLSDRPIGEWHGVTDRRQRSRHQNWSLWKRADRADTFPAGQTHQPGLFGPRPQPADWADPVPARQPRQSGMAEPPQQPADRADTAPGGQPGQPGSAATPR